MPWINLILCELSECFKNAFEKDPIENKKQKDKLEKETFPSLLKKLLAFKQQSSGAYLVGNDVSKTQNNLLFWKSWTYLL